MQAMIACLFIFLTSCDFSRIPGTDVPWIALVLLLLASTIFLGYRLSKTLKEYRTLLGRQKALMEENIRLANELFDLQQDMSKEDVGEPISSAGSGTMSGQEKHEAGISEVPKEHEEDTVQAPEDRGGSMLISQVSHVWVQGNYIHYKVKDNPKYHMRRDSLKNVYARLQQHDFVQTHKSYLINMAMVRHVRGQEVILEDGSKVPLSRKYKDAFREEYKRYNPIDF